MVRDLSVIPIPAIRYNKNVPNTGTFLFSLLSGLDSICIVYLFLPTTTQLSFHLRQYQFVPHLVLQAIQAYASHRQATEL